VTPDAGSLEPAGAAAVLRALVRAQRTGLLRLTHGRVTKTIYVSEGRLIFATSTDPEDRLGEQLLRKGLITYRAYEESVRGIEAGRRQGSVLVERGDIRARELVSGVAEQVQEIIFSVFRWEDGAYEFREGPLPSREVIVLSLSSAELVLEGIRRVSSWSRIRAGVGPLDQGYRLGEDYGTLVGTMKLQREELNLLAALDGTMSVEAICEALSEPDFTVCRALWGLWATGVLDRVPQDTEEAGAAREGTEPRGEVGGLSLAAELEQFNERHRFVYELVRHQVQDGSRGFLERAFRRVAAEYPRLFHGVSVGAAGELDHQALEHNIRAAEIARFAPGLDRLLQIEVELAREVLGEARAAIIADGLLALREHQLQADDPSSRLGGSS
jgi:hypothetical protein